VSEGRAPSWGVMVSRDMVVGMDSPGDVAVAEGMASSLKLACWRRLGHFGTGVVVVEAVVDTAAALAVVGGMSDCLKVHVHPACPGSIPAMPCLCISLVGSQDVMAVTAMGRWEKNRSATYIPTDFCANHH